MTQGYSGDESWLRGVFALLLTPFSASGTIDTNMYDRYIEWQTCQQPAGLFAVCGTSEMKWLAADERLKLARGAVTRAGGLPVLATGNLDPDPSTHKDEMRRMEDTGVTGLVLVPPAGVAREVDVYSNYLSELADSVTCPIVLYEWPQSEDYFIDADMFGSLVAAGRVQGIKDTTCTREGIAAKQRAAGTATVFQANTPYIRDALDMGVRGLMMVTSAARCDLVVRLWAEYQNGHSEAVASLERELVFLDALLRFAYPATAKYLMNLQGIEFPLTTRWPVTLTSEMRQALAIWQRNGLGANHE